MERRWMVVGTTLSQPRWNAIRNNDIQHPGRNLGHGPHTRNIMHFISDEDRRGGKRKIAAAVPPPPSALPDQDPEAPRRMSSLSFLSRVVYYCCCHGVLLVRKERQRKVICILLKIISRGIFSTVVLGRYACMQL